MWIKGQRCAQHRIAVRVIYSSNITLPVTKNSFMVPFPSEKTLCHDDKNSTCLSSSFQVKLRSGH